MFLLVSHCQLTRPPSLSQTSAVRNGSPRRFTRLFIASPVKGYPARKSVCVCVHRTSQTRSVCARNGKKRPAASVILRDERNFETAGDASGCSWTLAVFVPAVRFMTFACTNIDANPTMCTLSSRFKVAYNRFNGLIRVTLEYYMAHCHCCEVSDPLMVIAVSPIILMR